MTHDFGLEGGSLELAHQTCCEEGHKANLRVGTLRTAAPFGSSILLPTLVA